MFTTIIADDPSRKNVYVEIYYQGELVAEVIHESNENELIIYNHPTGRWKELPLTDFINVLVKANIDMVFPDDDTKM